MRVNPEETLDIGKAKAEFQHNPSHQEIAGRVYAGSPIMALRGLPRIPVTRAKGNVLENDVPTGR